MQKKQLNIILQSQIYTFVARTSPQGQCIWIDVGKNHLQFLSYKKFTFRETVEAADWF